MTGPVGRIKAAARRLAWRLSYVEGPRMMSTVRKRWQIFRNPDATIRFGNNVIAGPSFKVHAPFGGTLIIGDHVEFRRNFRVDLGGPEAQVTVGDECHFTLDVNITCDTSVTIGRRVALGQNNLIADGNHKFRDLTTPSLDQGYDYRAITIGDDAMVHSKVTILNDIGERAVIGANAVIVKPIPPYTVAAGVPAKVLDYFGPPGQEPEGWRPASTLGSPESGPIDGAAPLSGAIEHRSSDAS